MNKKTITERIRSSGKHLEVSMDEIMKQMIEFYNLNEINGMKKMFEAYKNWELNGMKGKEPIEKTIQRAKENFDVVAREGDTYIKSKDTLGLITGMINATKLPGYISGKISQFYRDAVDYQPFNPNIH